MHLPKVILPPALALLLLIAIIYGMGSCVAVLPQPYRVRGPWVVETVPEREVVVETASETPLTISLFSWGARFSEADRELGTLKYDRVSYILRDAYGTPIWKMTCHDTYVEVADPRGNELFRIVGRPDGADLVDAHGAPVAFITVSDGCASLTDPDGSLLARTAENGTDWGLVDADGEILMRLSDRSISPAGIAAAGIPMFDTLERAVLLIMVK